MGGVRIPNEFCDDKRRCGGGFIQVKGLETQTSYTVYIYHN